MVMRFLRLMGVVGLLLGLGISAGNAQDKKKAAPKPFTIDQVIHPMVRDLPQPDFRDNIVSMPIMISSASPLARKHVQHGMAYIEAAWDFEAYRHFCAALKHDKDCLMAFWGIGLALLAPNNEFMSQRRVAVRRMVALMDARVRRDVEGKQVPVASPMELDYCEALAVLYALRQGESRSAFKVLADKYPKNLHARCLWIYLLRDGYNEFGEPNPGQEQAVKLMQQIVNDNPKNVGVLSFWAMLHAEAPEATTKLRKEILPVVRKIERLAPDCPPYQHLLGHFEWRCGNHRLAEAALTKASSLYASHMKKHGLTYHNCDGWVRCQLYLATAMHSRGRFDEAIKLAKQVSKIHVSVDRLGSSGSNLVIWEGMTLPARLYLARGQEGDFAKAIETLPAKNAPLLENEALVPYLDYLEGLWQYLKTRQLVQEKNLTDGTNARKAMEVTLIRLASRRVEAMRASSASEFLRAFAGLEVYHAEARGQVALAGDATSQKIARSWFKSASEKQLRPLLLMPPVVASPMEVRLAEYYAKIGDSKRSAESYWKALQRRPNDLLALQGYQVALTKLNRKEAAGQIGRIIQHVRKP